ncbi:hypothetical protein P7C70_g313, partial [Phenoliferia sp. Uapishka_3]
MKRPHIRISDIGNSATPEPYPSTPPVTPADGLHPSINRLGSKVQDLGKKTSSKKQEKKRIQKSETATSSDDKSTELTATDSSVDSSRSSPGKLTIDVVVHNALQALKRLNAEEAALRTFKSLNVDAGGPAKVAVTNKGKGKGTESVEESEDVDVEDAKALKRRRKEERKLRRASEKLLQKVDAGKM